MSESFDPSEKLSLNLSYDVLFHAAVSVNEELPMRGWLLLNAADALCAAFPGAVGAGVALLLAVALESLLFAALHLSSARFVAKVDDDSYLHAPGLAQLLRREVDASAPHARTYIGTLTWYSWFKDKWDRCGFGWTHYGSDAMGQHCRNASWAARRCVTGCGPAVGPFPFAAGYLVVLSQPLAARRLVGEEVVHGDKDPRLL